MGRDWGNFTPPFVGCPSSSIETATHTSTIPERRHISVPEYVSTRAIALMRHLINRGNAMLSYTQASAMAIAGLVVALSAAPRVTVAAISAPPAFIEENISDFMSAARSDSRTESVQHLDPTKYRAFRYLNRDRVVIGAAQSISVTSDGRIDIVPVRGTSLTVRPNTTHHVFSHLALPLGGRIAASLLQRSR